jgi:UMF1 family MFS transporter
MKSKKEIFGWAMFDFANSAYTTNIVTVIFCNYFTQAIVPEGGSGNTLWGLGGTISNLLIILTAPVIGAIADFSSSRKKALTITCLLCVATTAGLFFATPGAVMLSLILFVVSNYFFQISEALCGSFLPDLAEPHEVGRISGFGWSLGYFGGLLGLVLCYPLLAKGGFGVENSWNLRLTNLITAGLFLVAATPTFILLKEHNKGRALPEGKTYIQIGFSRVGETLRHLRQLYDLSVFLVVFFLSSVALMTVFAFSSIYSAQEMGFNSGQLLLLFIAVQLSAAAGAFGFGFLQDRIGLKFNMQILLLAWVGLLAMIYYTYSVQVFWVLVLVLGALLGSVQSAARGLTAMFAPPSKSAEIFGFWSLTYKLGGMIGPLMYGWVADSSGHRPAMLCVSVFFMLAFLVNLLVDEKRGREAGLAFERYLSKS